MPTAKLDVNQQISDALLVRLEQLMRLLPILRDAEQQKHITDAIKAMEQIAIYVGHPLKAAVIPTTSVMVEDPLEYLKAIETAWNINTLIVEDFIEDWSVGYPILEKSNLEKLAREAFEHIDAVVRLLEWEHMISRYVTCYI